MLVPGKFAELFKQSHKDAMEKMANQTFGMGFTVSQEMVEDDMYGKPFIYMEDDIDEPTTPEKVSKLRMWYEETFGMLTAELAENGHVYRPIIKWYRIHYALTREAREDGSLPFAKRFGIGHYDFECDIWHYYLKPLHLVAAVGHFLKEWISWKLPHKLIEIQAGYYYRKGFSKGAEAGWRDARMAQSEASPYDHKKQYWPFKQGGTFQAPPATATEHTKEMAALIAHLNKETGKVKEVMMQQMLEHFGLAADTYVMTAPNVQKPYVTQYMNDPIALAKQLVAQDKLLGKTTGPPPIEAGSPVGVSVDGLVYALTDGDLANKLFGVAMGMPDSAGNVQVQTSYNSVTMMKAFIPTSTLGSKHED